MLKEDYFERSSRSLFFSSGGRVLGPASYLGPTELRITRTDEKLKICVLKICWRDGVDRCLTLWQI